MHNQFDVKRFVLFDVKRFVLPALIAALLPVFANSQTSTFEPALPAAIAAVNAGSRFKVPRFDVASIGKGVDGRDESDASNIARDSDQQDGIIHRSAKRILKDQKEIYTSPFKASNLKWDAIVLAPTAGFLVADRHIENNLPGGHYSLYQNTSDIAIGGLSGALLGVWLYGIKTDHHHARETGELELETLVDTFLLYAPMQFIAARQRPGEGNGHGDFLRHSAMNTSFPGGHAMFTWAMATVLSHEYSQKWVQVAAYGSAFTVTLTRFLARDHWASDMWVGTALGIGVGAHVFHSHCNIELSPKCRKHARSITMIGKLLHVPPQTLYKPDEYYSSRPISQ